MRKQHKNQHTVPKSYLNAWCDSSTPQNQEPYVWTFLKDGTGARKRAPKKLFTKNDYYTVGKSKGERDLSIEARLAVVESAFISIRDQVLTKGKKLNDIQRQTVFLFIAAMHARNPNQIDHTTGEWNRVHEFMSQTQEGLGNVPVGNSDSTRMPGSMPFKNSSTATIDDVKQMLKEPVQSLMVPAITAEFEGMIDIGMNMTFLRPESGSEQRFITSDNPAVWYDPERMRRPPMQQVTGLVYESIEITLPISPNLSILLNRKGNDGYRAVSDGVIHRQNRRSRFHAIENIITHRDYFNPNWI